MAPRRRPDDGGAREERDLRRTFVSPRLGPVLLLLLLALALTVERSGAASAHRVAWRRLRPGVSYATMTLPARPSEPAGRLHAVRIDPRVAPLRSAMASAAGGAPRSAHDWCARAGLCVAINLGMYQKDYRSNVGYARAGAHVNGGRWATSYKSLLLFGPKRSGLPAAALIDLDGSNARRRADDYQTAIQNLRLIRAPGRNVWTRQPERWSEAAVAMDREGRILFLFCREPYSMWELNRELLALPLGIRTAMHVEGGPEASLSIHTPALHLDLNGSFETGFSDDSQAAQWPIPNVLGVAAR